MKTAIAHLHSSKESMYELGKQIGLSDAALEMFVFALYEVKFQLEVDDQGCATIVRVDDQPLGFNGTLDEIIDNAIKERISKCGTHREAAQSLAIDPVTIWRRLKKFTEAEGQPRPLPGPASDRNTPDVQTPPPQSA